MSNPLDDLPKHIDRDITVAKAESEISMAISERAYTHGLTYAELIQILALEIRKWAQRQERHDRGESASGHEDDE